MPFPLQPDTRAEVSRRVAGRRVSESSSKASETDCNKMELFEYASLIASGGSVGKSDSTWPDSIQTASPGGCGDRKPWPAADSYCFTEQDSGGNWGTKTCKLNPVAETKPKFLRNRALPAKQHSLGSSGYSSRQKVSWTGVSPNKELRSCSTLPYEAPLYAGEDIPVLVHQLSAADWSLVPKTAQTKNWDSDGSKCRDATPVAVATPDCDDMLAEIAILECGDVLAERRNLMNLLRPAERMTC
eukprot:gene2352-8658_t